MGSSVKPLAVGLIQHRAHAPELLRSRSRIALAAYAHRAGFCLLRTFELDGNAVRDDLEFRALIAMAGDSGARVVIIFGDPGPARVAVMSRRAGLRLLAVPVDGPVRRAC
ncbi:MAG: hypothetical protein QG608_519 [Actinomycetota bacterium]|nr:hypothetical protein [Actinomycetota bacterium]